MSIVLVNVVVTIIGSGLVPKAYVAAARKPPAPLFVEPEPPVDYPPALVLPPKTA